MKKMNNEYQAILGAIIDGFNYCAKNFWNARYANELRTNIQNVRITETAPNYDADADAELEIFIDAAFNALDEMRELYEKQYEFAYEETGLGAPTDIDPFDIPEIQTLYDGFIQWLNDERETFID